MPRLNYLLVSIIILFYFFLFNQSVSGCMAGGGQNFICCPPYSPIGCAPSVPICSGYSSYGGSYEKQIFYPRPFTYQINNECNNCENNHCFDGNIEKEKEEYQKIKINLDNSENECNQQQNPCHSTEFIANSKEIDGGKHSCNGEEYNYLNCKELPLSISDENLFPCINNDCYNENNLFQINSVQPCSTNCNNLKNPSDSLPIPLPFATQSTEFPIAISQNPSDYESLDNNENELLTTTTTLPISLFSSPIEVSPSSFEEILPSSLPTTTTIIITEELIKNEIITQNPYENNKLLEQITTTTNILSSSNSLILNYEDENNEILPKIEEMAIIGNGGVLNNKEKTKENENEELKINNCEDFELRKIVEKALLSTKLDNLEAARNIEINSAAKFGGRFNSIVSNSEFAYVNWYGKRNCQLRVGNRHSLTWED